MHKTTRQLGQGGIGCASGGRTLAAGRSMDTGAVGMRSRLFLKTFPDETGSEEKARRSGAEVTNHPPKSPTTFQITSEQDSAHDADAAVRGSHVCHWVCRLHTVGQPAEQGARLELWPG